MDNTLLKNAIKHLQLITKHKCYVAEYCFKTGLYWRGLVHDLSKYSPTEFWESIHYYKGSSSPINECKKIKGWSNAWMHHKGRNPHHYEYWIDKLDDGGVPLQMPFPYALELICDYLAAGRAYADGANKEFTYKGEYDWWIEKSSHPLAMNMQTKLFIEFMLKAFAMEEGISSLNKDYAYKIYKYAEKIANNPNATYYQEMVNRIKEN